MERSVPVDVAGVVVPVISAEDLIVTKVLAGRATDIEAEHARWNSSGRSTPARRSRCNRQTRRPW